MIKKCLCLALCCLLLVTANVTLLSARTKSGKNDSAKIKKKVEKLGTNFEKVVKVKMLDGKKIKGYINSIGDDSFEIRDPKTNQITTIPYTDVAKVSRGLSTGAKIGIIAGIGGAIALAVGLFYGKYYCNEQAC